MTCFLGLSNGYLTSCMTLAPKIVVLQLADMAAIVLLLFLDFGLAVGSVKLLIGFGSFDKAFQLFVLVAMFLDY